MRSDPLDVAIPQVRATLAICPLYEVAKRRNEGQSPPFTQARLRGRNPSEAWLVSV
jgi:hypothetical protein